MCESGKKKHFFDIRYLVPGILLFLPLTAYPLLWQKIWTAHVPFWGEVQTISLPVMGLCASGALCFAPERFKKFWMIGRFRFFLIFAIAGIGVAFLQKLLFGGPETYIFTAGFFFLLPVAGMLFSAELKRLFPWFAAAVFFPAVIVTCRSGDFSGWAGNWNWNFSLLTISFTGLFFLCGTRNFSRKALTALGCSVGGLILISLFQPAIAPRGTFAGLIAATVCVIGFRHIQPARRWAFALWAGALTLILFTGSLGNILEKIRDSRLQLWRGSFDAALAHFPLGIGFDRFESFINPYLPELYYFTPYAATRHPHPHNEFLNYTVSYGLVGAVFFILLILLLLRGLRYRDKLGMYLAWSVLLLAVHGQFDVLLGMPLTGTWFLLGSGAVIGNGLSKRPCFSAQTSWKKIFKTAGMIFFFSAFLLALKCGQSTWFFRRARLALMQQDPVTARKYLKKSLQKYISPNALYTAGAVELFNFRNPDGAVEHLRRISDDLGLPMVYHSNALLARAYAVRGEYVRAINCFDRELQNYPLSALASGLRLSVLKQIQADSKNINEETIRFHALMKLRNLKPEELPVLLKNQLLDDAPLKMQEDDQ